MFQETIKLDHSDIDYPARLRGRDLRERYPSLWVTGDARLLNRQLLGVLCSTRCPGEVILRTYDLARALRAAAVPVVGGFHSPMEKESLELLLRGTQPVVVCPARSLDRMRVPATWRSGVHARRVLIVSPFTNFHRRVTANLAEERNNLVAALAKEIVVLHANAGGRIDRLSRTAMANGNTVWTLDLPDNADLIRAGAQASTPEALAEAWRARNDSRSS
jgi:predicted Rossmann fold nucleotide-binding protein DprA/Smf involved in DNA uptake